MQIPKPCPYSACGYPSGECSGECLTPRVGFDAARPSPAVGDPVPLHPFFVPRQPCLPPVLRADRPYCPTAHAVQLGLLPPECEADAGRRAAAMALSGAHFAPRRAPLWVRFTAAAALALCVLLPAAALIDAFIP